MTDEHVTVTGKALELREAFNHAFARAPVTESEKAENYFTIRVGGDAHAVALAEIAGIFADTKIASLPSRAAAFLGVAALRGAIVPIYSLRALLGQPPAEQSARWLMLTGGEQFAAFAFDQFEGCVQLFSSQISSISAAASQKHIKATAMIAGVRRSIISVPSMMDTIASRTNPLDPLKER